MTTTPQAAISIPRLRAELAGQVIAPDDPEYERARQVFLPQFDRRPAVIVRPVDADEVAYVVSLAGEQGLELAVRSGGHSPDERADEAPVHEAWVTDTAAALRQADAGAYVNFLGNEGDERVRAAYPGSTWSDG